MIISIHASDIELQEINRVEPTDHLDVQILSPFGGEPIFAQTYPSDTMMYAVFEDLRRVAQLEPHKNDFKLIRDEKIYYASPKTLQSFGAPVITFSLLKIRFADQNRSMADEFEEGERFGRFSECKEIRYRIDRRQEFFNQWPNGFICTDDVGTAMIFTANRKAILYIEEIQPVKRFWNHGHNDTRYAGSGFDRCMNEYVFTITFNEQSNGRLRDFLAETDVYRSVLQSFGERFQSASSRGAEDARNGGWEHGTVGAFLGGALGGAAGLASGGPVGLIAGAVTGAPLGVSTLLRQHTFAKRREHNNETACPFHRVDGEVYVW